MIALGEGGAVLLQPAVVFAEAAADPLEEDKKQKAARRWLCNFSILYRYGGPIFSSIVPG